MNNRKTITQLFRLAACVLSLTGLVFVIAARAQNAVIVLDIRAGHHIVAGNLLGHVHPPAALTPTLRDALMHAVLVGSEPTPVQDLEFSIRQLVELGDPIPTTGCAKVP